VPSPLYGTYQREWHFSPLLLTVIFAVYALAALASVLVTGSLSDNVGRKPVLVAALALMLAGIVVFIFAQSVLWLLVARALHGAAIGTIVVSAGAALLDLRPGRGAAIGRITAVAFAVGMAAGAIGTAFLGQYGPYPLVIPYVVIGVMTVAALAGTVLTRETLSNPATLNLRVQPPKVPAAIRASFRFSALGVFAAWAVLGLYLSLGPKLAEQTAGSHNLLIGGSIITIMIGGAAITQLCIPAAASLRLAIAGDLLLGLSLVLNMLAVTAHSAWMDYATTLLIGIGYGAGFSGSLRHLTAVIPARHRGQVMSAYYLVAYGSLAVPAVLAGAATSRFGLTPT
jgi:MFS family permease